MRNPKQEYYLTWLSFGLIIISVTLLLIHAYSPAGNSMLPPVAGFATWAIAVASALFLLFRASGRTLQNLVEKTEKSEEKESPKPRPKVQRSDREQLDIQGTANKIVRRLSLGDDPEKWGPGLLSQLVSELEIMSGILYFRNKKGVFSSVATYAYPHTSTPAEFIEGEGLNGQAVKNRQVSVIRSLPEDYMNVFSGLGSGKPGYLGIIPIMKGDIPLALLEVAGYRWAGENLEQLFQIMAREISNKLEPEAIKDEPAKK